MDLQKKNRKGEEMYYLKVRRDEDGKVLEDRHMVLPHELMAQKRILFLYGPIVGMPSRGDSFGPSYIADTILAMSSFSDDPVYLVIDSDGGIVDDGFVLYDAIKSVDCPVYTIGRNCSSMAAILLSAGKKGHRYLFPHSRVMLHLPSGQTSGNSEEIRIQNKEMQRVKESLVSALLENGVSVTRQQLLKQINIEHWMNSEETIQYGIADKIIEKGFFSEILKK